jgi:HAD superfamily hydrolase (TIGR01509 family)
MKYKAVIFDLDGTLIDSMGIWLQVDKEYLQKRNIPIPPNLFADVPQGNSFNEICRYFKDKFDLPDSLEEIGNEWTEMVSGHYKTGLRLKPGADNLISYLDENNIKMAVGTSNSRFLAETVLRANGVLDKFACIIAGCMEIKGKPYPDIFLKAAADLNMEPSSCLVIEDTLLGIKAAHNGGMDAYAIFDEHSTHEKEKIRLEADFYADNFSQILEKLHNSTF